MRVFTFTPCYEVNLLLLLFACFVSRVNSQNDTESSLILTTANVTATTTTKTNTKKSLPVVKCGNTQKMVDECFNELPPHLMEFLQTTKIAINDRDVASKCTVFHRGMQCFDEYTARCLPNANQNLFKNNVEGARNFFIKFCNDRNFQQNYMRHKDCFTYIQEDWVRCTKSFQEILTEMLHVEGANVTKKFMEFCCARNAYEKCIYNSARYKCYPHSANFARDTAKMLSDEKHFSNCRQYENALCRAADGLWQREGGWRLLLWMLLLLLVLLPQLLQQRRP